MSAIVFFVLWIVLTVGPGLYLWSKVRGGDPFLGMSVVLGSSLGATMLVLWGLYGLGLYGRTSLMVMVAVFAVALGKGLMDMRAEDLQVWRKVRVEEWVVFVCVCGFSLGMVYCVVGSGFSSWDALVSWDKWAVDISRRSWIGGYVSGGYPLGIPLVCSVFYRFFLPDEGMAIASLPGLMLPAMMQVFPLLLGVSLLSVCRTLKISPVWVFVLVFGNAALVRAMVKFVGYVDVPLAAFVAAAMAWVCALQSHAEVEQKASSWTGVVTFLLMFGMVFTKGNGFVFLGLLTVLALALGGRRYRRYLLAVVCALGVAGVFYLHQWVVGVWVPSLAETDPFEHALMVKSSHKYLVKVGLDGFCRVIDQWGGYYRLTGGVVSRAAFVGVALMLVCGVFSGMFRVPALWLLLVMGIMYRTSSYDERNALCLVAPIAVLFVTEVRWWVGRRLPQKVRGIVRFGVLLVGVMVGWRLLSWNRFAEIATRPVRSPRVPEGLAALRDPTRRKVDFLETSKLGKSATHIYISGPSYRRLRNAVYTLQQNAVGSECAHDLAFSSEEPLYVPPKGFVPIGRAKNNTFGSVLHLYCPTRSVVNVVVEHRRMMQEGGERVKFSVPNLPASGLQSGVLEVSVPQDVGVELRSLNREVGYESEWGVREDGATCLRLPYECDPEGVPRFELETREVLTDVPEVAYLY